MVFHPPRLWQFQRARAHKRRRCQGQTLFGGHEVPADTPRREILEGGEPDSLRGVFPQLWEKGRRAGGGGRFTTTRPSGQHQGTDDTVAREGSEYCHSTTVQWPPGLRPPAPQGRGHSSHTSVGATVVRAGAHQGLPLEGEAGRKATAARAPQACERTAGTRRRQEPPPLARLVIGADLSAQGPVVAQLQQVRLPYVRVAKPSSQPPRRAAVAVAAGTAQSQSGQWPEGSGARQRPYP